jgi:hypothetical protein
MEVHANITQKVFINPKDVIEKLIEKEVGWRGWIFEKDGKYYKGHEESAGCHSMDIDEEIPQEEYEYIKALQLVLKNLKD